MRKIKSNNQGCPTLVGAGWIYLSKILVAFSSNNFLTFDIKISLIELAKKFTPFVSE